MPTPGRSAPRSTPASRRRRRAPTSRTCRLAASDPTWAAVQLAAKPGAQFDAVTVIVHGGAGSWTIVASGGTDAGCGAAPQQVIVDLGQFCAGTGGDGTGQ